MLAGLLVFGLGGVGLATAPLHHRPPAWWYVASALLLAGIFLIASGSRGRLRPRLASDASPPAREPALERDPDVLVPMLGALIVYKYRWINEWQLERVLEGQRKQRKQRKRLGEILLEMGLVTRSQLGIALDYQTAYLRDKRARVGRLSTVVGQAQYPPQTAATTGRAADSLDLAAGDDGELVELLSP
jgi:hypothetical protein